MEFLVDSGNQWGDMFVTGNKVYLTPVKDWYISDLWNEEDLRPKGTYCMFNAKSNIRKSAFFSKSLIESLTKEEFDKFCIDFIKEIELITF